MSILKRSIVRSGHKTNATLENEFWEGLRAIAKEQGETISQLIAKIDDERDLANLSSAIRMFVLRYYRDQIERQYERLDIKHSTHWGRSISNPFAKARRALHRSVLAWSSCSSAAGNTGNPTYCSSAQWYSIATFLPSAKPA
jgi:predicted DNA-binding ribbon-helix-helix protein